MLKRISTIMTNTNEWSHLRGYQVCLVLLVNTLQQDTQRDRETKMLLKLFAFKLSLSILIDLKMHFGYADHIKTIGVTGNQIRALRLWYTVRWWVWDHLASVFNEASPEVLSLGETLTFISFSLPSHNSPSQCHLHTLLNFSLSIFRISIYLWKWKWKLWLHFLY